MLEDKKNTQGSVVNSKINDKTGRKNIHLNNRQLVLWLIQQQSPESCDYNVCTTFRIKSELSLGVISDVFVKTLNSQPAFRTRIYSVNGEPVQEVAPRWNGAVNYHSVIDEPYSVEELLEQLTKHPFPLDGEMADCINIIEEQDSVVVQMLFHRNLADGTTEHILAKTILAFLKEATTGVPAQLPDISVDRYYEAIMRHDRDDPDAMAFWQDQLQGIDLNVDLSLATNHLGSEEAELRTYDFSLDSSTSEQIKTFSAQNRGTTFCFVTAILGVVLNRCFRANDFALGYVRDVRAKTDAPIAGYFVERFPMPIRIDKDVTGVELLQDIRQRLVAHRKKGDISAVKMLDMIKSERDGQANDLNVLVAQTIFSSLELSNDNEDAFSLTPMPITIGSMDADLVWLLDTSGQEIRLRIQYKTSIFNEFVIQSMEQTARQLISEMLAHGSEPIHSWELVAEQERNRLLAGIHYTEQDVSSYQTLSHMFIERVAEQPDAIAVIDGKVNYTYQQMHELSNLVTNAMLRDGVAPGSEIGICMTSGVAMVAAILGIHKAGCAYIPLDPTFPIERLELIIDDAKIPNILAEERYHAKLGGACPHQVEFFSIEQILANEDPQSRQQAPVHTDSDLAVILYTSGSTGRPKGVQIQHQGLINSLNDLNSICPMQLGDRIPQLVNYVFDAAAIDIHLWYTGRGTLTILPNGKEKDIEYLVNFFNLNEVTHAFFVPAMLTACIDYCAEQPRSERFPSLKSLIVGGDRFPKVTLEKLRNKGMDHIHTINIYGPTEGSIYCTRFNTIDWQATGNNVPIGTPVTNMRTYILDEHLKLLPYGFAGELCIAGMGVTRGYRNLPEKNAATFVQNPFEATGEHARMYRTGDAVRFLEDGNIEFISRIDTQVKIRGLRIELGEIEERLIQYEDIALACAVVKETSTGPNIVAYFTSTMGNILDPKDIANFLNQYLPSYMIPHFFQQLSAIPTTASGKFDRKSLAAKALVEPEKADADTISVSDVPKNVKPNKTKALEEQLQSIWQDVLQKPNVDKQTNFFEQGGHSLLITKVVQKTSEELGIDISVPDFFRFPTIHDLSNYLSEKNNTPLSTVAEETTEFDVVSEHPTPISDIAVVGLSCRFPGANNASEFWQNLVNGVEGIQTFSDTEMIADGEPSYNISHANYVARKGLIDNPVSFDAQFFNYSPREAEMIDPQQRIFLEEAYHTLEDAGYADLSTPQNIGVYGSVSFNLYTDNLRDHIHASKGITQYQIITGNGADFLCTRIAYKLNLSGPAITVQTACSSSLVAVERACADIRAGMCKMALAGGASLISGVNKSGYQYREGMIFSPDGHCRTFDYLAKGTVPSQGVGMVLLKPLKQALRDHDTIRAVVKGAAINNDGNDKVGFTAPSTNGQKDVIRAAQKQANIDPSTISYIEAHGTATPMGDPIEIAALTLAFSESKQAAKGKCAIGSVKSNLGHCDAAAGIAGFIKTVLCLEHKMLVPSLHYTRSNPAIDFQHSPFQVNTELSAWPKRGKTPRRAGVSAFGIGGTNAHVVLEEAPELPARKETPLAAWYCLPVSASTESSLQSNTDNLMQFLQASETSIEDISYTFQVGRHGNKLRKFAVISPSQEISETVFMGKLPHFPDSESTICFYFGSDISGDALDAYRDFNRDVPAFHTQLNEVLTALPDSSQNVVKEWLQQTDNTTVLAVLQAQLIAFINELALARMLSKFGWHPAAVTGQQFGLVTAACFSGILPVNDGIALLFGDENAAIEAVTQLDTSQGSAAIFGHDAPELKQHHQFTFVQKTKDTINRLATAIRPQNQSSAAIELYQLLGSIWCVGNNVIWRSLYPESRPQRVVAPHYAFENSIYYIEKIQSDTVETSVDRNAAKLEVQNKIAQIWETQCEVTDIQPDQNLSDLGAGSLMALNIIDTMNEEFGTSLSASVMYEAPTLAELAERIYTETHEEELAEDDTEDSSQFTLETITAKVASVWEEHLNIKNLVGRDDFFDLGGDSVIAMGLFDDINEIFSTRFSANALYEASTLEKFSALIEKEIKLKQAAQEEKTEVTEKLPQSTQEYSPLVTLQTGTDEDLPPVFLVHAAGGGVIQFSTMVRKLGREYTVFGLDSPVDMQQNSIEELARLYSEAILARFPKQQNFILGGHSFGPIVALEIGCQLRELGREVDTMIVIDAPGPEKMPQKVSSYTQILLHLNDDRLPLDEAHMLTLSLEEQIAYMKAKAGDFIWRRAFNIITPMFIRDFKKQMDMMFDYRYPTLDCDGVYFTPTETMPLLQKDMYTAWQKLLQGKVEVVEVEGNHISMIDKPGATTIAESMKQILDGYK